MARTWLAWGVEPSAMIGHSMGEYTAACLAGVFTLEEAVDIVMCRGRLFDTLEAGSMLSVPLAASALRDRLSPELSIAAINRDDQCVVSGPVEAIEALAAALTAEKIETPPGAYQRRRALRHGRTDPGRVPQGVAGDSAAEAQARVPLEPHRRLDHRRRGDRSRVLGAPPALDGPLRGWNLPPARRPRADLPGNRPRAGAQHLHAPERAARRRPRRHRHHPPPPGIRVRHRLPDGRARPVLAGRRQTRLGRVRGRSAAARPAADLSVRAGPPLGRRGPLRGERPGRVRRPGESAGRAGPAGRAGSGGLRRRPGTSGFWPSSNRSSAS